jgi:cell division protein FtsW (lipid II flippase)
MKQLNGREREATGREIIETIVHAMCAGLEPLYSKTPAAGPAVTAALLLSALLVAFGSGPAGSDARVNLGPFRPVEAIKIMIVFYLAAYFDRHWEFLRLLKQKGVGLFALLGRLGAPRLVFFLPVAIAMAAALLFFFAQKDLGPALVLGCTFLSLYAVARKHYALIAGGLLILAAGLVGAYRPTCARNISAANRSAMGASAS